MNAISWNFLLRKIRTHSDQMEFNLRVMERFKLAY